MYVRMYMYVYVYIYIYTYEYMYMYSYRGQRLALGHPLLIDTTVETMSLAGPIDHN